MVCCVVFCRLIGLDQDVDRTADDVIGATALRFLCLPAMQRRACYLPLLPSAHAFKRCLRHTAWRGRLT
jgi:hypothetical protein